VAEDPTVNLPKIGKVKRSYILIGVAVVGTAAVIYWRNRNAAAASSSGLTTDPAGNVGTIDPATGFVYGSPQDLDALNAMAGSSTSSGGGGGGGSSSGAGDTSTQVSNGPPFASNAAWAQYAANYLVTNLNMDPGTVGNDLGKYLAGAEVTTAERDVITQAIAFAGPVPVAGPSGYPPSIRVSGSTAGPGGAPGAVSLSVGATTDTTAVVKWVPVSGATSYGWSLGDGSGRHGTVSGTSITVTALKPNTSYTITIHANGQGGTGPNSSITVKTRAAAGGGSTTQPSGSYAAVTVVKYTPSNPAWNSTISGIANHYGYPDWHTVWDDPKNAGLRSKRGNDPSHIQAGDTVYVKRK